MLGPQPQHQQLQQQLQQDCLLKHPPQLAVSKQNELSQDCCFLQLAVSVILLLILQVHHLNVDAGVSQT